ncbi:hypothetical protein Ciccas_012103 [Cichlidogyrus casuarinus]|uniref:Uncharacterized protein n=1 Tax=Cichlidogyrus casuarinus TaxID=1844966 RepID=A0ABD2PPB9_9PLAT
MHKSLAQRVMNIEKFCCSSVQSQSKPTSDYQSANASTTDSCHTLEESVAKHIYTAREHFSSNNDSETVCQSSGCRKSFYKPHENDPTTSMEYDTELQHLADANECFLTRRPMHRKRDAGIVLPTELRSPRQRLHQKSSNPTSYRFKARPRISARRNVHGKRMGTILEQIMDR